MDRRRPKPVARVELCNYRATGAAALPDDPLELQSELHPEAVTSVASAASGSEKSVIT